MKCYLGDASRGHQLSHQGVNSKLNLKVSIFADANRITGKTYKNKECSLVIAPGVVTVLKCWYININTR